MQEIERKFLLNRDEVMKAISLTPSNQLRKLDIEQFYIQIEPFEIRFRRTKEKDKEIFYKTIKKGSGLSREEIEQEVSFVDYENNIIGSSLIIRKTRYIFNNLEVDLYPNGLAIMEKEYSSEEEANNDKLNYKFIKKEVTGNKYYSNASIAQRG